MATRSLHRIQKTLLSLFLTFAIVLSSVKNARAEYISIIIGNHFWLVAEEMWVGGAVTLESLTPASPYYIGLLGPEGAAAAGGGAVGVLPGVIVVAVVIIGLEVTAIFAPEWTAEVIGLVDHPSEVLMPHAVNNPGMLNGTICAIDSDTIWDFTDNHQACLGCCAKAPVYNILNAEREECSCRVACNAYYNQSSECPHWINLRHVTAPALPPMS